MAVKAPLEDVKRVISAAVDGAFYRSVYEDITPNLDVLRHYVHEGWREGRDPAPWFSNSRYLAANADVAEAGAEPLHHFLTRGRYEGRDIYPSDHAETYLLRRARAEEPLTWQGESLISARAEASGPRAAVAIGPSDPRRDASVARAEFDADFYLAENPDVAEAGADPLTHFVVAGWREGRDPAPWFSVRDYLETNTDVAQAGLNPFVHYLQAGRAEGRAPRHDLGFRYDVLVHAKPIERRVEAARAATAAQALGSAASLRRALADSRSGLADLHLTFSHDDYTANLGGVQLCLQREAAGIARLGRDHLHLFPAAPWPVLREAGEPGALGVIWNGAPVGVFAPRTIAKVLGEAAADAKPGARSFAIHSLLGHSAPETIKTLAAVGLTSGYFWLHDFASLCAGFHLLRDDVEDCAAPPPDSAACRVCAYGPYRARHLQAHEALFRALDLTVVSPSEPTLALWRRAWRFPTKGEVVLPHARLRLRGAAPASPGPFRLAFVGLPATHKGWPVFRELAARFAGDPRYAFLHLGARPAGGVSAEFLPAVVTADAPKAMQQALEDAAVDAVLLWPLCRETFSFAAYEAVAAGAAVITNPDSGNVAAFVRGGGFGQVVADEGALSALFESGEILALARHARRPALYDLAFSGMSVDLLKRRRRA